MKKDFYDKPIYTISNYIINFFLSSVYLSICNILLILFFIFTAIDPRNFSLLLLFICLIPLGPSLGALYSTIGKIIREKDIYFSSYFWSSYKNNFVSYLKLWLIEIILLTILFIDFQYFYLNMPEKGIHIIFVVLIIISLVIGFYTFPINSRFEIKLKDLFIISIYYMIKKFPTTILKIAVIILIYYLSNKISIIFLIFIPNIICFIFFYYDKSIFTELETKFLSSDSNK
ncbi:hypothetical protein psyc5s11_12010 [Clostridium gelidum]|uniref:DUF624 domain-containing protein n=1 Tax=Clostridium gelidum TaxID=704125 RepID=A0ABN6IXJ2_9CLOT|nr:DUF624 domain-containing protein [Clostridium gelidum]BCZ45134.1 hypothetical protein psyc5s11_12010 [Clostridium gelidum]